MPQIGDIRKGIEIGYHSPAKRVWAACPICSKERWVSIRVRPSRFTGRCSSCSRHLGNYGKGGWGKSGVKGKHIHKRGYWSIKVSPDDFFYSMSTKNGYVLEHRLVMAKHLGRSLHTWEIIHHRGTKYPKGSIEDKRDNRIENLQLVTDDRHRQITLLENRIKYLEQLLAKNGVEF